MSSPVQTPASQKGSFIAEPLQSMFLSLAPATSNSYPQPKKAQRTDSAELKRRASSDSSKSPPGARILKLGPVHEGEHLDDNQADWHEVAVV